MGNVAMENASADTGDNMSETAEDNSQSETTSEGEAPAPSRGMRLGRLLGTHALVFLIALSLFAAADSWSSVTGLGIATLLSVITGALAGITLSTLVHEWFHYAGARYVDGSFDIPARLGLFLYDWDFSSNNQRQFLTMSVAGSVGGLVALIVLWNAVPADSWGRAALRSGVIASVIFAALIEWPVIRRVRQGADPLSELSKIDPPLLKRSFTIAGVAGIVMTLIFVP
jgi:hypothetical protein